MFRTVLVALSIVLPAAGCARTASNAPAPTAAEADAEATLARVVAELEADPAELDGEFPELGGFGEGQWKDPERPLEIRIRKGVAKVGEMRGVLASDLQPNGISFDFMLLPEERLVHMTLKMPRELVHLDHLDRMLLSEFVLSDQATEGLGERLDALLERYRTRLEEIDESVAGSR